MKLLATRPVDCLWTFLMLFNYLFFEEKPGEGRRLYSRSLQSSTTSRQNNPSQGRPNFFPSTAKLKVDGLLRAKSKHLLFCFVLFLLRWKMAEDSQQVISKWIYECPDIAALIYTGEQHCRWKWKKKNTFLISGWTVPLTVINTWIYNT